MSFQPVSDSVYNSKYQLFDKHGNAVDKDRDDSFLRVAKALAKNEVNSSYWETAFFNAMLNGAIPAGRILGNAGAEEHKPNTSLINCIVSDTILDSIESIGKAIEESLITLSGGSGIGYEFSSLRPKGSYVAGVGACFTEDTEILDVNLNSISFKDLEQKLISEDVYTFSTSPNGSLQVSKILKCWVTKQAKTYVKVTLDNGSIIKCTTDHKFLLRSGEYISAINLTPNMSLMPLYHKTTAKHNDKNLRNYVLDNLSGKYIPVYKLSSHRKECKALQVPDDVKVCVHHKDFNSLNDEPTNLEFLTESDHFRLHTLVRNADPDFQAILAKTAKERANKLWEKLRNDQDAFAEWQRKQLAHRDDPLWKQRQSSIAQRSICSEAVIEKRVQNHKKYVQQNRESFNVEQNRRALKGQETRINSIIAELKQRNMALTSANFDHIGLSKSNGCGASFKKAMKVRPDLLIDFIDNKINPYNRSEKRCETCINKVLTELKSRKLEKTISAFTEVMDELYEPAYLNWPLIKHHFPEFPTLLTEYNHTVQKVEFCTSEKLLNFYDLEVDVSFHNFPLACGVFVHNSTSGPLPFADIFDKGCFTIASAGGRRGAQMATFDLRHPDVLDFIKVKREDGRFRQFNISVLVPQSFFNEETEWTFRFPIRSSDPTLVTAETMWDDWHVEDNGYITNEHGQTLFKIYGKMPKSEIWNLILQSNYEYAEPGIIFIDRLNQENNLWFCEAIRATNPCVVAGTKVLTRDGYKSIETLVGQSVDIWNGYEWSNVVPKITGENQKVLSVQFSNGSSLTCTLYHRFKLQDNIIIEAQDLKLYDKIETYFMPEGDLCKNIEVIKIEDAGIAELVYCFNEPKRHTAVFNGIVTSQCGEQALPPNGSCLLGSIDLTQFVEQPFTDNASFNFGMFADTVDVFTRMLDNVVEFNNLPLQAQRDEIIRKRRHGMGFFGLGSALILLGIRYDSSQALEFAEKVTKLMAIRGYMTGCELAKEKGSAPILDEYFELTPEIVKKCPSFEDLELGQRIKGIYLFLQSPYMQRLLKDEPQLKQDLLQYGCRFSHHTSIAPTGTISLALGNNTSGGIEPQFSHQYFRNLTVEGKKTRQQQAVYSKEFLLYKELYGKNKTDEQLLKELPDYFVTADTISWKAHVDMVAVVQKWVDSSISKTINVPTDIPFKDFEGVYEYAFGAGCKAVSTFRYNPETLGSILSRSEDLANSRYEFKLADGTVIQCAGGDRVEYDGEVTTAENLFSALKENTYGKF